jgi:hypothetical protein
MSGPISSRTDAPINQRERRRFRLSFHVKGAGTMHHVPMSGHLFKTCDDLAGRDACSKQTAALPALKDQEKAGSCIPTATSVQGSCRCRFANSFSRDSLACLYLLRQERIGCCGPLTIKLQMVTASVRWPFKRDQYWPQSIVRTVNTEGGRHYAITVGEIFLHPFLDAVDTPPLQPPIDGKHRQARNHHSRHPDQDFNASVHYFLHPVGHCERSLPSGSVNSVLAPLLQLTPRKSANLPTSQLHMILTLPLCSTLGEKRVVGEFMS